MEKGADQKNRHELDSKCSEHILKTEMEARVLEDEGAKYSETCEEVKIWKKEVEYDKEGLVGESLVISSTSLSGQNTVQVKKEIIEGDIVTGYKLPSKIEVLRKPGREGWLREVVYSRVIRNLVVNIYYIPPGGKTEGNHLLSKKDVQVYLNKTRNTSTLTLKNFAFNRRIFGLGNDWEVSRMSSADCTQKKLYKQFFEVIEGSSPPTVSCNLCDGKHVSYIGFSKHMEDNHLPDENCPECHKDIPAGIFRHHKRVCDGTATEPSAPQALLPLFSQFYKSLEGTLPPRVSCNLCDGKSISRHHFTKHMRNYHLPDENCSKCLLDFPARIFAAHTRVCMLSDTDTTDSNSIINSNFFTEIEDTTPQKVACNLCDTKLTRKSFSRHYMGLHMNKMTESKSPNKIIMIHSSCSEEQKDRESKQKQEQEQEQYTDHDMGMKQYVQCKEEVHQPHDDIGGDPNKTLQSEATIADDLTLSFSSSNVSEIDMYSENESE